MKYADAIISADMIAILYYQCVLTAITLIVAVAIGVLQLLSMVQSIEPNLGGSFWHGVLVAGNHYDIIGAAICGSFILFGGLSILLYKPWRRRIDHCRRSRVTQADAVEPDGITRGAASEPLKHQPLVYDGNLVGTGHGEKSLEVLMVSEQEVQ